MREKPGTNPGRWRQGTSIFLPRTAVKSSIMESEYCRADTWLPQSRKASKIF